jgi:hypothetical protein
MVIPFSTIVGRISTISCPLIISFEWKIRFPHPERGEDVEVVSPPPPFLNPAASVNPP